jgi:hypothetical protein
MHPTYSTVAALAGAASVLRLIRSDRLPLRVEVEDRAATRSATERFLRAFGLR